jgi:hypothetical protein
VPKCTFRWLVRRSLLKMLSGFTSTCCYRVCNCSYEMLRMRLWRLFNFFIARCSHYSSHFYKIYWSMWLHCNLKHPRNTRKLQVLLQPTVNELHRVLQKYFNSLSGRTIFHMRKKQKLYFQYRTKTWQLNCFEQECRFVT